MKYNTLKDLSNSKLLKACLLRKTKTKTKVNKPNTWSRSPQSQSVHSGRACLLDALHRDLEMWTVSMGRVV